MSAIDERGSQNSWWCHWRGGCILEGRAHVCWFLRPPRHTGEAKSLPELEPVCGTFHGALWVFAKLHMCLPSRTDFPRCWALRTRHASTLHICICGPFSANFSASLTFADITICQGNSTCHLPFPRKENKWFLVCKSLCLLFLMCT